MQIVRLEPPRARSADMKSIGIGDDGKLYALKRVSEHAMVPISEWICNKLARSIDLSSPEVVVAVMPDRIERCFASRFVDDVVDHNQNAYRIWMLACDGKLSQQLSEWFGFDLFVRNLDRHLNNYLLRLSPSLELIGIDYSRAFMVHWPLRMPPLESCKTTLVQQSLQKVATCEKLAALTVVRRLGELPDSWIDECLADAPAEWLDDRLRLEVARWWRKKRRHRLKLIRNHIANGRYLQLLAHTGSP